MQWCRKLFPLGLTIMMVLALSFFPIPAFAADRTGTLSITTSPAGADVYINNVLQTVTTPCSLPLKEGSYHIALKIKGYETYSQDKLTVKAGKTVTINRTLLPQLVEVDTGHIITVNSEGDSQPPAGITISDLSGKITLRDAVEAIKNDTTGAHYRIEFAPEVSSVVLDSPIMLDRRGNLTINGDKDRDGTADIAMKYSSSYEDYRGAIDVYSSDTYIIGLNFDGSSIRNGSTLDIRVPNTHQLGEKYQVNNLYILGNNFKDSFETGISTCGGYGYAATSYDGDGTADFSNLVYAGNTFINTSLFSFAGAGDEDYNVIDGYYISANTFYNAGIGMMASDAHTRYVYGDDVPDGNGGTPGNIKYCEHNILRNVLIDGNVIHMTGDSGPEYQGIIYVATSDLGNSESQVYNVEIRNNKSIVSEHYRYSNVCIMNVSLTETGNNGKYKISDLEEYVSGNLMHDISVHDNDFEMGKDRPFQIINVFTDEGGLNGNNNKLYNVTVNHNKIMAPDGLNIADYDGKNQSGSCKDNTVYGISIYGNEINAGSAVKAVGITAAASTQSAWDSDKMTAYSGSMTDIKISQNKILQFDRGIVVAGCSGNAADDYCIDDVEVKDNIIECGAPDSVGSMDYGITVAGSAYSQSKYGNTNCKASNIRILNNHITAAGGIAVAGTAIDLDIYGKSSNNCADQITIQGNIITKAPDSWSKRPQPPILICGIFSFWDGKISAGMDLSGNAVNNIKIKANQYKDFKKISILNLASVPDTYAHGSKADSDSILKALNKVTDKAFRKASYRWSWDDESFDSKKAGAYLAVGKSIDYDTGIDRLYYEVTVSPLYH